MIHAKYNNSMLKSKIDTIQHPKSLNFRLNNNTVKNIEFHHRSNNLRLPSLLFPQIKYTLIFDQIWYILNYFTVDTKLWGHA